MIASGLVEAMRGHVDASADHVALRFVHHDREQACWSYAELDRRAASIAIHLREARGQPVLLIYPPGLDFVAALWACLDAGAIAVPVPYLTPARSAAVIGAIAADCGAALALGAARVLAERSIRDAIAGASGARCVATDALAEVSRSGSRAGGPGSDTPAVLQYTSGSTARPRGVVVTHGNLAANLAMIARAAQLTGDTRTVSFLPHFHDMGLIGGILQSLYMGGTSVLMPPLDFIQRPVRWLRAISSYRADAATAPLFAYTACADRTPPEQARELDLRSWRIACCGAEPVRAEALQRFCERFAPAGFDPGALFPCYGLAEATLYVCGGPAGRGMRALPAPANGPARVSCGPPPSGQTVLIADPATRQPLADGAIGEIWIAGPNVASGYWQRPEETQATFGARLRDSAAGPFLRTGDLGFLDRGEVVITGRLKNVLIVRGLNHQAEDLEATAAGCHPALAADGIAAIAVDAGDREGLVLLHELGRGHAAATDLPEVARAIIGAVCDAHGVRPLEVQLLRPGTLPRTTSNKIRRGAARSAYLAGALQPLFRTGGATTVDG